MFLNTCMQGNINLPVAELVLGYTWVGGDRAPFDNNFSYSDGTVGMYNQKRDWDSQAQLPAKYDNKPLVGLTYWYANDATNYAKKVKQLLLYYWSGTAWILHATLNTTAPTSGGPLSQEFDLRENPMPNPTGKVRIIGRNSWDTNSYRWVTECRFTALV